MDPNALMIRFLDALVDGDRAEVAESVSDLHEWVARGGALPDDPREALRKRLAECLQVRVEDVGKYL